MALLFMDGFDHYATADVLKKWSAISVLNSISTTAGRRGGGAATFNSSLANSRYLEKLFQNSSTVIIGAAMGDGGGGFTSSSDIIQLIDSGTVQVAIFQTLTRAISVYRGPDSTLLGTSANGVIPATGFFYVEVKVFISSTVGTVDVRINGTNILSLTGLNTKNTANSYANTLRIAPPAIISGFNALDDVYICDATGSTNNNFLGDCRIDTILPTADGNYSQWTPNTGTVHFNRVNESAPDLTTYNAGLTVGDRDSYGMADLAALSSQIIYGVQVNAAALKDDAGSKSIATMVRSGGVDGDGATAVLGTSQLYVSQVFETNPNGSIAWTEASVNAMEAGVKVTA